MGRRIHMVRAKIGAMINMQIEDVAGHSASFFFLIYIFIGV